MRLLSARFRQFRNLADVRLDPGPRATVLVGENGQGKTNTLEGLFWLGTLKPLRATRLVELVRFGASETGAEVEASFEFPGGPRTFSARIAGAERQLNVDGKRVQSLDDYFGALAVVAFTPDDLALVKGAPDERRRFLDRAVFARFPAYLGESRDYLRALKARNRLLREGSRGPVREVFDAQLARLGAKLWRRRRDLLETLESQAGKAFDAVGRLPAKLRLTYRSAGVTLPKQADDALLEQLFLEGLDARLPTDLERGFTSVGPHADDLGLYLDERPARLYASQGQQRAIVLALKIGEIETLRSILGRYPLLLLDDVSSELDPERNGHLMSYLRGLDSQVILTTTDLGLVSAGIGGEAVIYRVKSGTLERG
jgi:DNA replication and repair protein RecF